MTPSILRIFLLGVAFFSTGPLTAHAEIYKWVDAQGVTHYSSKKGVPQAQQAELPKIMRAEVKVPKVTSSTCAQHGGANCAAGADSDGSVVCYDGFRDASPRFNFVCSAPKLEISDISDVDGEGAFTVFVRNSKAVEASKPALVFKRSDGEQLMLQGPEKIEGFGVGEFVAPPEAVAPGQMKPASTQLLLSCLNCPQS